MRGLEDGSVEPDEAAVKLHTADALPGQASHEAHVAIV